MTRKDHPQGKTPWGSVLLLNLFTVFALIATIPLLGCDGEDNGNVESYFCLNCGSVVESESQHVALCHQTDPAGEGTEEKLHWTCVNKDTRVPDERTHERHICGNEDHWQCVKDDYSHTLLPCNIHYDCEQENPELQAAKHVILDCKHVACDPSFLLACGHHKCTAEKDGKDHSQCPIGKEWICQETRKHTNYVNCPHTRCGYTDEEGHEPCQWCDGCVLSNRKHGNGLCNYMPADGEGLCPNCNKPFNEGPHGEYDCGHYVCGEEILPLTPPHEYCPDCQGCIGMGKCTCT